MADFTLDIAHLLTRQPFPLCAGTRHVSQLLAKDISGDIAHFRAPLLPERVQMMVKTLGFIPFGAMQTHNFLARQDKFQLPPYQTTLAMD